MIAILDTNGMRLVVWGVGRTESAAQRDADQQNGYAPTEHARAVPITAAQALEIKRGVIDAETLGLA
jgi:hypothetical protein